MRQALDQGKLKIIKALETNAPAGKADLNNASSLTVQKYLMDKDPLHLGTDADQKYTAQAQAIVDYRDKSLGGVLTSIDQLKVGRRSGCGRFVEGWLLSFRFRGAKRRNRRAPGRVAAAKTGGLGHSLLVGRDAGLPGLPF